MWKESRKWLFFSYPLEENIRHSVEHAQIRFKQKQGLEINPIVPMWFKKKVKWPRFKGMMLKPWKLWYSLYYSTATATCTSHQVQIHPQGKGLHPWWKQKTIPVPYNKTVLATIFSYHHSSEDFGEDDRGEDFRASLQVTQIYHTCLEEYI